MQEAYQGKRLFEAGKTYVLVAGLIFATWWVSLLVGLLITRPESMSIVCMLGVSMLTHVTDGRAAGSIIPEDIARVVIRSDPDAGLCQQATVRLRS